MGLTEKQALVKAIESYEPVEKRALDRFISENQQYFELNGNLREEFNSFRKFTMGNSKNLTTRSSKIETLLISLAVRTGDVKLKDKLNMMGRQGRRLDDRGKRGMMFLARILDGSEISSFERMHVQRRYGEPKSEETEPEPEPKTEESEPESEQGTENFAQSAIEILENIEDTQIEESKMEGDYRELEPIFAADLEEEIIENSAMLENVDIVPVVQPIEIPLVVESGEIAILPQTANTLLIPENPESAPESVPEVQTATEVQPASETQSSTIGVDNNKLRNLEIYKDPIHEDALKIWLGSSSLPSFDLSLTAGRNLSIEEYLQQNRSLVEKHGVDMFIYGVKFSEGVNVIKENNEIVQIWARLIKMKASKQSKEIESESVVGIKISDLLAMRDMMSNSPGKSAVNPLASQSVEPAVKPTLDLGKSIVSKDNTFIYNNRAGIRVNVSNKKTPYRMGLAEYTTLGGARPKSENKFLSGSNRRLLAQPKVLHSIRRSFIPEKVERVNHKFKEPTFKIRTN